MDDLGQSGPPDGAFALHIETACEDFEILQCLISGQLMIRPQVSEIMRSPTSDLNELRMAARAPSRIQMALAKSFVFNVRRANRILEFNKHAISLDRPTRKHFLKVSDVLTSIRDINEHGYDGRRTDKKPSLHEHEGVSLDETSLFIQGLDKILMGPVNLAQIYPHIVTVRSNAGFSALCSK